MSRNPSLTQTDGRAPVNILVVADQGAYLAPEVTLASGHEAVTEGQVLGKITASKEYCPLKRSNLTETVANPTAVDSIKVQPGVALKAGETVDIIDGDDGTTEHFADKVIQSITRGDAEDTITFTAALGASTALGTNDFIQLATLDGAENAKRIALDYQEGDDDSVRGLIHGLVTEANVKQIDTYGVKTALNAASLDNGVLSVG